ncbi:MAG: hypothetical protein AAFR55_10325, partial [Pseudomonadota bacterium]
LPLEIRRVLDQIRAGFRQHDDLSVVRDGARLRAIARPQGPETKAFNRLSGLCDSRAAFANVGQ